MADNENGENGGNDWGAGQKLRAPFWNMVSEMSMNPKEGLVKEEVGVSGPETEMQRSSAWRAG